MFFHIANIEREVYWQIGQYSTSSSVYRQLRRKKEEKRKKKEERRKKKEERRKKKEERRRRKKKRRTKIYPTDRQTDRQLVRKFEFHENT